MTNSQGRPQLDRGGAVPYEGGTRGAKPAARVLVVDDDEQVRTMLGRVLRAENYEVDVTEGASGLAAALRSNPPDLVLLDIMLDDDDGRDMLSELRRSSDIPVILLSGLGEETDRVVGLKLGADDYVVKPFSPAELMARVQSVLRRSSREASPAAGQTLAFPDLTIDLRTREVHADGRRVELTAKEFDLLAFLAASPRQVFSRRQLLDHVWGSSPDWQDDATVTEHIRRIRRRLEVDRAEPRWVLTVRGAGYRFEP